MWTLRHLKYETKRLTLLLKVKIYDKILLRVSKQKKGIMKMPTLTELLEAGVHFGHKKERSHPKAKEFIFALREGIYVIDLEKTQSGLESATEFIKKEVALGKRILFVGTKKQAKEIVKELAESAGMPYVNQRWLGGTLTNFETIRRSIKELERLDAQTKTPEFQAITKKEQKLVNDKLAKLNNTFGGIKEMKSLPDIVFVVDANREEIVIAEAVRMNIPVVGIADTDANPEKINYSIPANDDAAKSLQLIMGKIREAVEEGQGLVGKTEATAPKAEIQEQKETKKDETDKKVIQKEK